jgi:hypothetical protein
MIRDRNDLIYMIKFLPDGSLDFKENISNIHSGDDFSSLINRFLPFYDKGSIKITFKDDETEDTFTEIYNFDGKGNMNFTLTDQDIILTQHTKNVHWGLRDIPIMKHFVLKEIEKQINKTKIDLVRIEEDYKLPVKLIEQIIYIILGEGKITGSIDENKRLIIANTELDLIKNKISKLFNIWNKKT